MGGRWICPASVPVQWRKSHAAHAVYLSADAVCPVQTPAASAPAAAPTRPPTPVNVTAPRSARWRPVAPAG